jgi:glycosyltransferase involved in cell wall biosynthesis
MLFPSIDEGTPWVVLEALSVGVPVLSHDCCGMADIIEDEFLIPPISYENSIVEFSGLVMKTFKSSTFRDNISTHYWSRKIDTFINIINNV